MKPKNVTVSVTVATAAAAAAAAYAVVPLVCFPRNRCCPAPSDLTGRYPCSRRGIATRWGLCHHFDRFSKVVTFFRNHHCRHFTVPGDQLHHFYLQQSFHHSHRRRLQPSTGGTWWVAAPNFSWASGLSWGPSCTVYLLTRKNDVLRKYVWRLYLPRWKIDPKALRTGVTTNDIVQYKWDTMP